MGKVLTLGEILIRYSTIKGERLKSAAELKSHYGGSEPNVSVGLSGLGHEVVLLSALPDNPLGLGALENLNKYQVNTEHIAISGERVGVYYVEVGAGTRATSVVYDRKYSSVAELGSNPWVDKELFKDVDIFHVSGITTALSPQLLETTIELMKLAKENKVKVSFDSNYRSKLWTLEEAAEAYKRLLPLVDYCSAGKLDAINLMGIEEVPQVDEEAELTYYYQKMNELYPNLEVIYSTVREVVSTDENFLKGTLWMNNQLYCSRRFHIPYIIDRIGGGDSFAAGLLNGLLINDEPQHMIDFATGMSVLKHTFSGDAMSISLAEVESFIQSESSKINR